MNDSPMPWVKLYTEVYRDPKLLKVPRGTRWTFIALVALAGECDANGALVNGTYTLTDSDLARTLHQHEPEFKRDCIQLHSLGLLTREEDAWVVTAFAKRQGRKQSEKREQWSASKRRQRAETKNVLQESNETVGECPTGVQHLEGEKRREEKRRGEESESESRTSTPAQHFSIPISSPESQPAFEAQSPAPMPGMRTTGDAAKKAIPSCKVPAIDAYVEIVGLLPNDEQKSAIVEAITDIPKWREVLHFWMVQKWRADSVGGMIDRYRNGDRRPRRQAQTSEPAGFQAIREAMADPRYQDK